MIPVTCVTRVSHRGSTRVDCRVGGLWDSRDKGLLTDALVLGRRVEALEPGRTEALEPGRIDALDDGRREALEGGLTEALEDGLRGALCEDRMAALEGGAGAPR